MKNTNDTDFKEQIISLLKKTYITYWKPLPALARALLLFILLDLALVAVLMLQYPQRTISPDELYGENLENLKEFQLDEDGVLTAQSEDPWIYFDLGGYTNIWKISVDVSYVGDTATTAQFYLAPEFDLLLDDMTVGEVSVTFNFRRRLVGIRFDLATTEGASLKVENVVLNDRLALLAECQRLTVLIYAVLFLLWAELRMWRTLYFLRRQIRASKINCERQNVGLRKNRGVQQSSGSQQCGGLRQKIGFLLPVGLQYTVKLIFGLILLRNFFVYDTDYSVLLYRMLFFGLEGASVLALWMRCSGRRQHMWCNLALIPFWAVAQFAVMELTNMANFSFDNILYLLLNLLCCCIPVLAAMLLLRRSAPAITLASVFFTILGIANHYYGQLRSNPLELSDIAQAGTAVNVVAQYDFSPDATVLTVLASMAALCLCLFFALGVKSWHYNRGRAVSAVVIAVAAGAAFLVGIPEYGMSQAWKISSVSESYGYLLSFVSYAKAGMSSGKPDGYSADTAESILKSALNESASASAVDSDINSDIDSDSNSDSDNNMNSNSVPNIIAIMNESFADLPSIYGFETTEDVLPNIHAMVGEENTITGTLLVSVVGGGTANTEYEFLTGNSLYVLPAGCSPYVQYVYSKQQTLAWHLQNLGYSVAAYHPYYANGYQRESNYPSLGLTTFYSIADELANKEYLRSFISDASDFQNIISLYEEKEEDTPFFIFNVTMQNHGGYRGELETTVAPVSESLQYADLKEYLTLIHETDAAYADLIEYFSQVDEDTIILMFGDHQPSISGDTYTALDNLGNSIEQTRYQSTFILWANFDIDEASDVYTSPNYLRSILLDQAGVELTAYESFLLELLEEYPAMNSYGYYDSEGNWYERTDAEKGSALWEYACLVYNNVFDKKNMTEEYYE
ncbi:MAG: LTA synthase family protein [Lachnospiraceae bacterium]|nr:LTA synthase family protein [Lachnospiraceae bacterium]